MPHVTFIRHAESASNVGLVTQDFSRIELTLAGREQAQQLAVAWIEPPDLIITSPFLRACQTADPMIERFPQVPVEIWPVEEFTNLEPTIWNGTRMEDRLPAVRAFWDRQDPEYIDGPGCESFASLFARAQEAVLRLAALPHNRVLLFSHGHFLNAVRLILRSPHDTIAGHMQRFLEVWREDPIKNCGFFERQLDVDFAEEHSTSRSP